MIKETIRALTHRKYKSADDLYRRRTKYGEINEFFKRLIIPSDRIKYGWPLLGNPFREGIEKTRWQESETTWNEYNDPDRRKLAEKRFEHHLGRKVLGMTRKIGPIAIVLPGTKKEYLYAGLATVTVESNYVSTAQVMDVNVLMGLDLRERPDAVAVDRGDFKL